MVDKIDQARAKHGIPTETEQETKNLQGELEDIFLN